MSSTSFRGLLPGWLDGLILLLNASNFLLSELKMIAVYLFCPVFILSVGSRFFGFVGFRFFGFTVSPFFCHVNQGDCRD